MKIGLIVPIGRTDKYGYQYDEYRNLFFESYQKLASRILVISSSRYAVEELFLKYFKVEFISNKESWFKLKNEKERFSLNVVYDNINFGLRKLRDEGFDVAIVSSITTYIPPTIIHKFKNHCLKMLKDNKPFSWIYRRDLCGHLFFNANTKIPNIINLRIKHQWKIGVDSIFNKISGIVIKVQKGNYRKYNKIALVDFPYELTFQDGKEKYEFVTYSYLKSKNQKLSINKEQIIFNKNRWINYYLRKLKTKTLSKDKLDKIGYQIFKKSKKNFLSTILVIRYIQEYNSKIKISELINNLPIIISENISFRKIFKKLNSFIQKLKFKLFFKKKII